MFHVLVAFSLHLHRKSMIHQALPGSGKVAEQTPACLDRFLMPAFVASSVVEREDLALDSPRMVRQLHT